MEKQNDRVPRCTRCQTPLENGKCPRCGFVPYTPMDDKKRKKIQIIGTAIGFAIFLIIFIILQWK